MVSFDEDTRGSSALSFFGGLAKSSRVDAVLILSSVSSNFCDVSTSADGLLRS